RSIPSSAACVTPGGSRGFRRGDLDGNGRVTVTDVVLLLSYLFLQGPAVGCVEAGDTDNSGTVDISDAIQNLNYQFLDGPAPAYPGPTSCGSDPTPPHLG